MVSDEKIPVIDGHNDTFLNLYTAVQKGEHPSFLHGVPGAHIDLPKAQAGGLAAGFFAIFTPNMPRVKHELPEFGADGAEFRFALPLSPPIEQSYALQFTAAVAGMIQQTVRESDGRLRLVHTTADLDAAAADRQLGIIIHLEGAEAVDADLHNLPFLYAAGVRSIGLVWSRPNAFGQGVPFQFPHDPDIGPGLTEAGKSLVRACNELGILVDVSHLNEKGFWDVVETSSTPIVATHSNAHALCPAPRNLTDAQLAAIAASGGIVGANFYVHFLRGDGRWQEETSYMEIVRHIDYMVQRIGIDHVGFGSDFDGVEEIPGDLGSAAGLPRLLNALRERGYDDAALHKLAYGNWRRVLGKTWRE